MRGDVKSGDRLLIHTFDSAHPLCGAIATVDYTIANYGKIICSVEGREGKLVLYYDQEGYYWQQLSTSADRSPQGQDAEGRLDAKHESAVPKADAQPSNPNEDGL